MAHVILTGGPGVGKTTLLAELAVRGFVTVPESARAIIAERRAAGLAPRPSPPEFARLIVERDLAAIRAMPPTTDRVFFDRALVDGLGMLSETQPMTDAEILAVLQQHPFHAHAFVLPPWEEIYTTDSERDQDFSDCLVIHGRILSWYRHCGFVMHEVPRLPVAGRADFVLSTLAESDTKSVYP